MPPTLSPAGRLRSRTSDISDLLRGRHDAKTSTDSQQRPPPIPTHLADPVTPTTKPKGKFSFLGRKRKPSAVSPSSARVANDAVAAKQAQDGEGSLQSSPGLDPRVDAPAGPGVSPSANKASLPPLNVSPPSLGLPQLEGSSSKAASPSSPQLNQRIPSGIPTATLRNLRPQKSTSFESSRRSNDSQGRKQSSSSARPIITISPPHNIAEGATEKFHSPRSAPRPPGQGTTRHSSQSGKPSLNSTLSDRGGPDSPSSEVPSSATSVNTNAHFPIPSVDGPLATTSYKEESLLRKDHFEIGTPEPQASQRRGTVSGTHQLAGGSVGRSSVQDHQRRRHVSVLHLNNVKQDAPSSSLPRARRSGAASDSTTSGNESTASSHRTVSSIARSKSSSSPGAKRRSCSESVLTSNRASPNVLGPRSGTAGSLDSVGRRSIESPTGSTEEGLYELQSSIAEFIAPFAASPPPAVEAQPQERPPKALAGTTLSPSARLKRSNTLPDSPIQLPTVATKQKQARRTSSPVLPVSAKASPKTTPTTSRSSSLRKTGLGIGVDMSASESVISSSPSLERRSDRDPHARMDSSTLSSIPSLTTLHTSSSGLSSIPETPRTDAGFSVPASPSASVSDDAAMRRKKSEETKPSRTFRRQSTSSLSSSTSSGSGSASYATSSRVSASPSIAQVLDRTSRQPEMDAILRKLRAFGHHAHGSP
ncbi:hypothetical protein FKP32DRAFT_1607881 [Trametes sanguinea]|nr:hypothetical protein FKP32DRAFT_1607881 [Trametes sanguinea]